MAAMAAMVEMATVTEVTRMLTNMATEEVMVAVTAEVTAEDTAEAIQVMDMVTVTAVTLPHQLTVTDMAIVLTMMVMRLTVVAITNDRSHYNSKIRSWRPIQFYFP